MVFDAAGTNRVCVLDVAGGVTVNSVDVSGGYTGQVMLQNPLTISSAKAASSAKSNILTFNSPAAMIGGYSTGGASPVVSHGDIYLPSGTASTSGMIWFNGNLADVTVHVGRASADVFAGVTVGGTGTRTMNGSAFDVDGRLNWSDGSVSVLSTPVSSITINESGVFNVMPGGGTWGVAAGVPTTVFGVINNGETTVQTNATLNAEFTNTANLFVGPYASATLTVGGTARQTGSAARTTHGSANGQSVGTIELNGPGEVYEVLQGWIGGLGIIDGNLTLGDAYLRAGPEDVFGNFSVADSIVCSGQSVVEVAVGDNHQISQLVVGLEAELDGGSLAINWATTQAPARVEHVLVSVAGQRCGEFGDFIENGRVANRGVGFKTTYLGGTGNDVSLIPTFKISGRVWEDINHDGAIDNSSDERVSWRNESWLGGMLVELIDEESNVLAYTYTGSDGTYSFGDLSPGQYTVRFYAPEEYYTFTNFDGYVGCREAEVEVGSGGGTDATISDIGASMPKMRVTIDGLIGDEDYPEIEELNDEVDLLYMGGGFWLYRVVLIEGLPYPRVGDVWLHVQGGEASVQLAHAMGRFATYWGLVPNLTDDFTAYQYEPAWYNAPGDLTFDPIFPG